MSIGKALILGAAITTFSAIHPQEVWADGYRNSDFLTMPPERQKFWLSGAINSLAHVAAFRDKEIGQCILDWYFGEKNGERNWLILESMKKYPDHKPAAVLLALTERTCGKYAKV